MSGDLAEALDACLESLARGQSVEQCLARHDGRRAEVEPLLRAALALNDARHVRAPERMRVAGRARVLNRVAARQPANKRPRPVYHARWLALRAAAAMLTLAALSGGAVAASANALPDQALYPVKRAVESLQVALAPDDAHRAGLYLQFAERRLDEGAELAVRGRVAVAGQAAQAYSDELNRALDAIAQGAAQSPEAAARLAEQLDRHEANMEEVLQRVPAQARPAIEHAIDVSRQGQQRALELQRQREESPAAEPTRTKAEPTKTPPPRSATPTAGAAAGPDPKDTGLPRGATPTPAEANPPAPKDAGKDVPVDNGKDKEDVPTPGAGQNQGQGTGGRDDRQPPGKSGR